MALFTVLLEFDGGTYISQVRAASFTAVGTKSALVNIVSTSGYLS